MSDKNVLEMKLRHSRSNKKANQIVSVNNDVIFSGNENNLSFNHLHYIYDTKFIPMLMGHGELATNSEGKKVIRVSDVKHIKLYQAWDMSTPD